MSLNLPPTNNRYSSVITSSGLGTETAKYNREEAMKQIHSGFLRDFNENQRSKAKFDSSLGEENDYERMSRARGRIVGTTSSYLDNHMARQDALRYDVYVYINNLVNLLISKALLAFECYIAMHIPKGEEEGGGGENEAGMAFAVKARKVQST